MNRRTRLLAPALLLLAGAVLLWIASRVVWLDVVAFNDQSGEATRALVGSEWQPALVPVALGAVAAVAAVSLVRGAGARAVGGVIALLGVAAGGLMVSSLGEPDRDRVHAVVTSEEDLGRANAGPGAADAQNIPEWSEISEASVRPLGAVLTGAGAITLVAAGVFVIIRPARKVGGVDRYVTPAARRDSARVGASSEVARGESGEDITGQAGDDSGRDLWQELDEGRDPTG